jgi:formylglycine-generating enzyme required for sulfatase activity
MSLKQIEERLTAILLEHFPADKRLVYEDFICDEVKHAFYFQEMIEKYFKMISLPWTEISWETIEKTYYGDDLDGLIYIMFLPQKAFVHVFPSLIMAMIKITDHRSMFDISFVGNYLNLSRARKDWQTGFGYKKEFYFSLDEKVKKVISLLLCMNRNEEYNDYWHQFRDTEKGGEAVLPANQAEPDLILGGLDLRFRRIGSGRFMTGSNVDQRYYDMYQAKEYDLTIEYYRGCGFARHDPLVGEKARHTVRIARPFYMGQYPVTQAQWLKAMGENPSYFVRDDTHPVENVSWDDAQAFIAKLNTEEAWRGEPEAYQRLKRLIAHLNEEAGLGEENGYVLRLPTEAEWEYACRAVSETDPERETKEDWRWFFGDDPSELEHYGWFAANAGLTTHPVGEKRPDPWGLYDLYGNVWEWAENRVGSYPENEITDPPIDLSNYNTSVRPQRGGAWCSRARDARSAKGWGGFPNERYGFVGLRLALAPRLSGG